MYYLSGRSKYDTYRRFNLSGFFSQSQDNQRQILNLKQIASVKGWNVKRVFQETVSGTFKTIGRKEFCRLSEYAKTHGIKIILVSEISQIGRWVVDILNTVDTFYQKGIGIYVHSSI
jgi:DNA invertase Pin-like site-specific DNA recombinase